MRSLCAVTFASLCVLAFVLWPRWPEFPRVLTAAPKEYSAVSSAMAAILNGYGCRLDSIATADVPRWRVRYPSATDASVIMGDLVFSAERSGFEARCGGDSVTAARADGVACLIVHLTADGSLARPDRRCAVLIDDFGEASVSTSRRILDLPCTLTVSVIPGRPLSTALAAEAKAKGREVMVHFPLEPFGYPRLNPGRLTITTRMSSEEIGDAVELGFLSVPGAVGANHHMGSIASADWNTMVAFCSAVAEHGRFYVDSRTTTASVGDSAARHVGLPSTYNEEFIDDNSLEESVLDSEMVNIARTAVVKGAIVVIGHPHEETRAAIERNLPEFCRRGVRLVSVSDVVLSPSRDVIAARPEWRPDPESSRHYGARVR